MNTKHLIAAVTLALVGTSSFAFEGAFVPQPASTMSRAQVKAELAAAVANKTMPVAYEGSFVPAPTMAATAGATRQAVRAETREYVRSGQATRDHQALSALGG